MRHPLSRFPSAANAVFVLLLAATALSPLLNQPYLTRLATTFLIYAIVVVSLDLLVGFGGMVSFGHAAFFGIGAYATAFMGLQGVIEFTIAIPVAIIAGGVGALVVGAFSLRTSGAYFIMITLAFAQMLYYGSIAATKLGGDDGVRVARNLLFGRTALADPIVYFYTVFALFLLVFFGVRRLVASRFGRTLRAIKDNEPRVVSVGYNPYLYKLAAFTIAGALAGLAGGLDANLNQYAAPSALHWVQSGDLLIMVILGGVGTLSGPVMGAALFLFLKETISGYTSLWMLIMGPLLLIIVSFSRGGVRELLSRLGERARV